MTRSNKTIKKYLATYAEPEVQKFNISSFESFNTTRFNSVLVIPIFDESIENLTPFLNIMAAKPVVLIWVFNCPDNAKPEEQKRTQSVMKYFIQALSLKVSVTDKACLYREINKKLSLFILDRCSNGLSIPAKQGVGLARKLGMDLGVKLIYLQHQDHSESLPWLYSSDADVVLPDNYFELPPLKNNCSAFIYPFEHLAEQGFEISMALYDFSLRYYVERLNWAGSPYAFHTIGSLIAVSPLAYAQVRGIPKRSGAEDFYLLNKLAKVGEVESLKAPVVKIAGRPSHRVPFGTGPALIKLQEMENSLAEYTFYHPEIFDLLKQLLSIISDAELFIVSADDLFSKLHLKMSARNAEFVITVLRALKLEKQFKNLAQQSDRAGFVRAFHTWFDGFVTLRFIHLLRDQAYPNISIEKLLYTYKYSEVKFEHP